MIKVYSRYVGFKLNLDGTLSARENLDNLVELDEWVQRNHYSNMIVLNNKNQFVYMTWNGDMVESFKARNIDELEAVLESYKNGKNF